MITVRKILAAKINHFVAEQRVRKLLELRITDLGGLCPAHFRPHCRRQGLHVNVPVAGCVVIELAGGMEPHVCVIQQ